MKKMPLVSVVVSCYNHEKYVQDCIQSIIDQTYENIELIIIDDGSKDTSVQKIEEMTEICTQRFVRFEFRHRENRGLCATLNEALDWCRGKYYSPFASDDIMLPERISIQIEFLEQHPNICGVFGGLKILFPDNKIKIKKFKRKDYFFEDILYYKHELSAPTAMYNLNMVRDVGGYLEHLGYEDWYLYLKLSEKKRGMALIPELFAYYRQHNENTHKNNEFMHSERLKVLKEFPYLSEEKKQNAESYCCLEDATGYILTNRKMAFKYYQEYLKLNSRNKFAAIFLDLKSLKFLIKFLIK